MCSIFNGLETFLSDDDLTIEAFSSYSITLYELKRKKENPLRNTKTLWDHYSLKVLENKSYRIAIIQFLTELLRMKTGNFIRGCCKNNRL